MHVESVPRTAAEFAPEDRTYSVAGAVPLLTIVAPTFNERENVPELIQRLIATLPDIAWEVLFVDDDSPDNTAQVVRSHAEIDARVRLLQRIGRRGLASASLEGILASTAEFVAVMDADLQHDESILPRMLLLAQSRKLDLVIATRNADSGSMGDFSGERVRLSQLGKTLSDWVCRCRVSDPMSGFFLVRRDYFLRTVHSLQGQGFKTLTDILASGPRPVRIGEIGYTFRSRVHGDSKLDAHVLVDFLFWAISKFLGRKIPTRFAVFGLVGSIGVAIHLTCLSLLLHHSRFQFVQAQLIATLVAMAGNFYLNNLITYSDQKLTGARFARGLLIFCLACSFGALSNVSLARTLLLWNVPWLWAGLGGIVIGSVWNYAVNDLFTWRM